MITRFMRNHGWRHGSGAAALIIAAGLMLAQPAAAQQAGAVAESPTTRLFDAVQANDIAAAQSSLAAGASLTARDRWGLTPIDVAIDKGHFDLAHFLLSVQDRERATAAPSSQRRPDAQERAAPAPATRPTRARAETAPPGPETWSVPSWPAGRPNPFDPNSPAPGARLPATELVDAGRAAGDGVAIRGDAGPGQVQ